MSYDVVVIDPPWQAGKGGKRKVRPSAKQQKMDYELLSLDEIFDIVHEKIQQCNNKHNVFIWCIDRMLTDCEKKMADEGYKLHARIIWDKGNGIAPAFTVRFSHEYLLWFYKPGEMLKPIDKYRGVFTDVLRATPREHSRKPDEAYQMLDKMFGNCKKLDVFARESREGWDVWGDETTKFDKEGV